MSPATALARLQTSFRKGETRSYRWRIKQLKGLKEMITHNENKILEALSLDLGRGLFEGLVDFVIFYSYISLYN